MVVHKYSKSIKTAEGKVGVCGSMVGHAGVQERLDDLGVDHCALEANLPAAGVLHCGLAVPRGVLGV